MEAVQQDRGQKPEVRKTELSVLLCPLISDL
jgi:hypothetical protein